MWFITFGCIEREFSPLSEKSFAMIDDIKCSLCDGWVEKKKLRNCCS